MFRLLASAAMVLVASAEEYNPGAYFNFKTVIIPHDEKKYRGGEDAAAADQ